MYKKNSGITLLELIAAVAVMGVVLTFAVPSFDSVIRNSRLTSGVNDLVSSLHLARTEATKRGAPVAVCRTDTPQADRPVCGTGSSWQDGWMVFADDDNTGHLSAGEEIIKVNESLEGLEIDSDISLNEVISYQPNGFAQLDGEHPRFLVYCDSKREDRFSRVLLISNSGRPQIISRDDSFVSPPSCSS